MAKNNYYFIFIALFLVSFTSASIEGELGLDLSAQPTSVTIPTSLVDLDDVTGTPSDTQVPTWNATLSKFTFQNVGSDSFTVNSTQFDSSSPIHINESWLTTFIQTIVNALSKWNDYFKLNQTIPQHIFGGTPTFEEGIYIGNATAGAETCLLYNVMVTGYEYYEFPIYSFVEVNDSFSTLTPDLEYNIIFTNGSLVGQTLVMGYYSDPLIAIVDPTESLSIGDTFNVGCSTSAGTQYGFYDESVYAINGSFNRITNIDTLQFNTTFVDGSAEGRLQWNSEDGTLEVGMPGGNVNLQIGQEELIKAKEASGQTIDNGDVVYISGASGQRPEVTEADADTYSSSFVLGVATETFSSSFGYVTMSGLVRDINTSGMPEGSVIWLSQETGKFTTTRPTAPAMSVFIGYVIYEHATEGIIAVRPILVPRMQGLSDVVGTPNQSGQMYQYNATSNRFELFTLETTYYNATSLNNVSGTYEGIINYTQHPNGQYDGITLNVTEVAGSPALDFRINFTDGIDRFNQGIIRYKTSSIAGELPTMQLWDYVDSEWEDYGRLDATTGEFYTITGTVFDYMSHVQDGTVQMRLYKASNGNINNKYYVDWLAISKGYGTPTGNEVDPLSYHIGENINMYQNNITNVTMLNLTEVSGACDLSAGAGISRNSTHYCFA